MTYNQAIQYLFDSAPMFQNVGAAAYKEGLEGTLFLDEHFGHPHRSYKTIHVAGTNGKGSVTHTLAAILQAQGYRVGLYTSPHLVDFRERIRVNGKMISKKRVIEFVSSLDPHQTSPRGGLWSLPLGGDGEGSFSFFELATALAFKYFEEQKVDFAVIEVGLGGRLDCTNIITPVLSVITNISFDHVQFLGDTLPKIASEKAGIIKAGIPVVIGENINEEVNAVFENKAKEVGAPIIFAESPLHLPLKGIDSPRPSLKGIDPPLPSLKGIDPPLPSLKGIDSPRPSLKGRELAFPSVADLWFSPFEGELERVFALKGLCQEKNRRTILTAVRLLREQGIEISDKAVKRGFAEVCTMTGLMGRWQTISTKPLTICDTGHNVGGMQYITKQLQQTPHKRLHIVIGMVSDKDVSTVLSMLPKDAVYYFTQASVQRAMPAEELAKKAQAIGQFHNFTIHKDVGSAYQAAKANASEDDLIFIGGSTFVVADLLKSLQ